jgi:hypothetical protein
MQNRIISDIDPYGEENWNDDPIKNDELIKNLISQLRYVQKPYISVEWVRKNILNNELYEKAYIFSEGLARVNFTDADIENNK